jgi:AP-4 complex subunit epsilon-1
MKELIVRSLYVEMLGQDASFAYIKAVELCASTNISQKKIGYLAGKSSNFILQKDYLTYLI